MDLTRAMAGRVSDSLCVPTRKPLPGCGPVTTGPQIFPAGFQVAISDIVVLQTLYFVEPPIARMCTL